MRVSCGMPQQPRVRWSGLLLSTFFAFSVLLPELGHSLAHRHLGGHEEMHGHEHARDLQPQAAAELEEPQGGGAHPHHDIRTIPSGKRVLELWSAPIVYFRLDEPVTTLPGKTAASSIVRADSWHGLPPPSRAPPLT